MSSYLKLTDLRVLNTRPLGQNKPLSDTIHQAGGIAIELPALSIQPTSLDWIKHLPDLTTIEQAVFISTNAVNYFFSTLAAKGLQWPSHILVSAIGKSTAAALHTMGISTIYTPAIAESEYFIELPIFQQIKSQKIILIKGEQGRAEIKNTLVQRGANVIPISVYYRTLPLIPKAFLNSLWQEDKVDIILFTSQQAMHNLFTLVEERAHLWLRSKPCIVISERLATVASNLGMTHIIISHYEKLIEALYEFKKGLTHVYQQ